MIRIKGVGAVYGEVWYDEELPVDAGVDIVQYSQRPAPLRDGRSVPFLSLVTDLAVADDEIIAGFNKVCRYELRRAARDDFQFQFLSDPATQLDEFCRFHDRCAEQRSFYACNRVWLASACAARQLILTAASHNGEALVWHAYVVAGKTAGLEYSCSYRDEDAARRALVGRANRWLHWQDMQRFKETGIERYDWGGLFDDDSSPSRVGINEFKKGFGGRHERSYDCELPITARGRLWLPVRDACRQVSRARPRWSAAAWFHGRPAASQLQKG
ncbi:MAG TPA: GNAT family N-acetyltransferase [Vicinamibacterales bacterium]|nr:GNAT family N-acetyltransferase [Vicinamibacterales bacterium]